MSYEHDRIVRLEELLPAARPWRREAPAEEYQAFGKERDGRPVFGLEFRRDAGPGQAEQVEALEYSWLYRASLAGERLVLYFSRGEQVTLRARNLRVGLDLIRRHEAAYVRETRDPVVQQAVPAGEPLVTAIEFAGFEEGPAGGS